MSYCRLPAFVLGFHGCDKSLKDELLLGKNNLNPSKNEYDWLGSGIYFWENDPDRALSYAKLLKEQPQRSNVARINEPAVIGAVIDLGHCLNLFEEKNLQLVKVAYEFALEHSKQQNKPMPENKGGSDLLLRKLDCFVINTLHGLTKKTESSLKPFDSVRAPFSEGKTLYDNSGFKEKNHIQICIINPKCIKGYFDPINNDY